MDRVVVAGLGNPGAEYAATRHNVGFLILESFLASRDAVLGDEARGVRVARLQLGEIEVLLAEPQWFMNRSGPPLVELLDRESVAPEALLVIHDDLDLAAGRLQMKHAGGTGGHRGLDSLVESLGTEAFPRLRIGIGRPPPEMSVVDFVLAPYLASETEGVSETIARGTEAIALWSQSGTESAMNIVNVRGKVP